MHDPKIEFRGTNGTGLSITGVLQPEGVAPWVEAAFISGWRKLIVLRDGREVGAIRVERGRRIWWAER